MLRLSAIEYVSTVRHACLHDDTEKDEAASHAASRCVDPKLHFSRLCSRAGIPSFPWRPQMAHDSVI
eukprot:1287935-Rhodomonas_salina.1